jgi:hypothetical protein
MSKSEDLLLKEFDYYLQHQKELVKKYNGKIIVIKNCKVIGVYDSEKDAFLETSKNHKAGTFLIQKCIPGTEGYTQTYHSRVAVGN